MAPSEPDSLVAIGRLVEASRALNDAQDAAVVAGVLADAADGGPACVVAVFVTSEDGTPALAEVRGVAQGTVRPADLLDSELGAHTVRGLPGVEHVVTHLLLAGGGLFGALVLGYGDPPPESELLVVEGLADAAAAALDRAFRTQELVDSIEELHRSQAQLARTEALRRLGQLAAVVAHEVKNPLASIGGVLQVLRSRFEKGSSDQQILDKVLGRLGDLDRMVNEILQFARPQDLERQPTELSRLLRETAEQFAQAPDVSGVEIELACATRVRAAVDRSKVQRVLLNLMLNAAQAMEGRGTLLLGCEQRDTSVVLVVADQGPGVPEKLRDNLFEPFVTTKARGTGLGLAVARQVAEAHGGRIQLAPSEVGARFELQFPLITP